MENPEMRKVETERGEMLKEKIGALAFFEISTKTGINADTVFEFIQNTHFRRIKTKI
jgi:hypothetical protein